MRPPLRHDRQSINLNMTPLIDVVFQLIIFFLVSSHLARQETQYDLELPTAASGREATAGAEPRVLVNVLPDGRLLLGSHATRPDQIAQRLEVERRRSGEGLEVRIRADRAVPYGQVEPVLLACAEAGVWKVTFAVYEKE